MAKAPVRGEGGAGHDDGAGAGIDHLLQFVADTQRGGVQPYVRRSPARLGRSRDPVDALALRLREELGEPNA